MISACKWQKHDIKVRVSSVCYLTCCQLRLIPKLLASMNHLHSKTYKYRAEVKNTLVLEKSNFSPNSNLVLLLPLFCGFDDIGQHTLDDFITCKDL